MQIIYDEVMDKFVLKQDDGSLITEFTPDYLMDAMDRCLLVKLFKIRVKKINYLDEYVKKHMDMAEEVMKEETDGMKIKKINAAKNIYTQIRHVVRLLTEEEETIRNDMLERQVKK